MNTAEDRMREAFDAIALPPDVKAAALEAIERARAEESAPQPARVSESLRTAEEDRPGCGAPLWESGQKPESTQRPGSGRLQEDFPAAKPGGFPNPTSKSAEGFRRNGQPATARRPRRRWAVPIAAAACLVAAAVGFGGYTAYATETAVVGIEINPSIELGINRFDTIVAARALNDDGEALLAEVSVVGDPYAKAIEEIAASDTFAELGEADAVIDVSVVCDDDAQAQALMQTSDDAIAACDATGSCHRATSEDHEAAANAGMGVGRYAAAEELMALDPSVTLDDCQAMSMREIVDAILAIDPDNAFAQERSGGHHGQGGANGSSAGGSSAGSSGNGNGSGTSGGAGRGSDSSAGGGNAGSGSGQGANGQGSGAQSGSDDASGSGSGHGHGQNQSQDQAQGQGQGRHHGWEER